METSPPNAKETLRAISVFFYAMTGGILMFTVIVFGLNFLQQPALADRSISRIFLIAVLFISAISISIGTWLYTKRMAGIAPELTLLNKLDLYRAALILYLALCEGGGLLAVIVYFLTGNKLLLIVIAFVILAMLQKRPEKFKIFNELQLSSEEQMELN
jgi:hypothetical protein